MPILYDKGGVVPGVSLGREDLYFDPSIRHDENATPSISKGRPSSLGIIIALDRDTIVEFSLNIDDDSPQYFTINKSAVLLAGAAYEFFIPIKPESRFNLRNMTTAIIHYCEVVEIRENS